MKILAFVLCFFTTSVYAAVPTGIYFGDSVSLAASSRVRLNLYGLMDFRHDKWENGKITPSYTKGYYGAIVKNGRNDGCAHTVYTYMQEQLAGKHFNVIVFNAGLHDIQTNISRRGCGNTTLVDYSNALEQAAALAVAHADIVIWVNTTPVPFGAHDQIPGGEITYNSAADFVMREHGIWIVETTGNGQRAENIHFTPTGYFWLAKRISNCILYAMQSTEVAYCHH